MDSRTFRRSVATVRSILTAMTIGAAIVGCNMPKPSATEGQGSDTGGGLATGQQALGSSGGPVEPEYMAGCESSKWYVCVTFNMAVKFFSPPGQVTYILQEDPCIPIDPGAPVEFDHVFKVPIRGKAEDDKKVCTFRGETTVTVTGAGHCEGSPDRGAMFMTIDQNMAPASATLSCTSKRDGETTETIVVLGGLGEQTFPVGPLLMQKSPKSECAKFPIPAAPVLTGEFSYCLTDEWSAGLVPLVP
jgi:hypothetical protein